MKKNTILVTFLCLTGLTIGCAEAPRLEAETALAALSAADSAEADLYVQDLYQAAQDSFAAAQAEIARQDSQSTFSRDYDRAKGLLQYTIETASAAQGQVAEKKEVLRVQTDSLIAQAQLAVSQAKELLARAPGAKVDNVALVAVREDAGNAETMLNEAIQAQAGGDVARAHELAKGALETAGALVQRLTQGAVAPSGGPVS